MIDWTKPIRTRKGEPAELIHELEGTEYPRVVVIHNKDEPSVVRYPESGRYLDDNLETMRDLENVPEVTNLWVNVYTNDISGHTSKKEAEYWAENDRVALLRLTVVDGILVGMDIEG